MLSGKGLWGKGSDVLVGSRVTMRQQHALTAEETNNILGAVTISFTLHSAGAYLKYCTQFWTLKTEKALINWSELSRRLPGCCITLTLNKMYEKPKQIHNNILKIWRVLLCVFCVISVPLNFQWDFEASVELKAHSKAFEWYANLLTLKFILHNT